MIIQHNIMALNSYNRLAGNNSQVSKNLEKLSSGYKINRAGDDAAGLAISEKMRAQITGLSRASQNAQDGVSLVQTAEGNLTEVHSMLNRMVDLATQSSNGTYDGSVDRKNLQKEVQALKDEVNRIAESANFNGIKLLDGSLGSGLVKSTTGTPDSYKTTKAAFVSDTSVILDNQGTVAAGTEDVKVTAAAAAGTKATGTASDELTTNGFSGSTDITLTHTPSANGKEDILNGKSISVQVDASASTSTAEVDADGNVLVKVGIDGKTINDSTDFDTLVNNALKDETTGADAELVAEWKKVAVEFATANFTAPTANVAAMKVGSFAGGERKFDITVAGGSYASAKIADVTATQLKAGWSNGKGVTIKATEDSLKKLVDDFDTGTKVAEVKKTDAVAGSTEMSFSANMKIGNTITIGEGNSKIVLEMIEKAGDATQTDGSIGIVLGADLKTTLTNINAKISAPPYDKLGFTSVLSASKVGGAHDTITLTNNNAADTKPAISASVNGSGLSLQIGDTADQRVDVKVGNMGVQSLGLDEVDVSTETAASASMQKIKDAINSVSGTRADLGAIQNRLEHTINNLSTTTENMTAAESRIRDTDMAKEMMQFTKNNVLAQAAQAMLAQANQQPQQVLQLLR